MGGRKEDKGPWATLYPVYRIGDRPLARKRGFSRERCATGRSWFVGAPLGVGSNWRARFVVPTSMHELDQPPSEVCCSLFAVAA